MSSIETLNRPAGMPAPSMDPREAGMWEAAAAGRLDIQKCEACGEHRNPPSDGCPACGSSHWRWDTMPGTGVIMTYVWLKDPSREPGDFPSMDYNVALVELDGVTGGPARIVTNIVDAWQPEDIQVGQRVELACVTILPGIGLPCFKRSGATG